MSWILMLDETRVLVGCKDDKSGECSYKKGTCVEYVRTV